MEAEFRLLGELELRVGDRDTHRVVDLGHSRQRCVLAALLVDANRLITADQLLDRVWADRPPRRARNALSGYLSRLRSLLAALAPLDVAIERSPGGYLLTVDPSMVDLHQFQELAAKGRAAADEILLERALGLWRGEAFGNLDTPWINDARARLDAERRAVELDFYDLALAGGRHGELLHDLWASARESPQDERLAGQLMLALYRGGRQSEALRHYESVRCGLADELGADPTPGLRDLHRRILAGDPSLSLDIPTRATALEHVPPSAAPQGSPSVVPSVPCPVVPSAAPPGSLSVAPLVVPRQLPAPPRHFTGRARELEVLDAAGPIIAVSGMAGVGKTALALHWAHAAKDRFPDGQLYLNLRGFGPDMNVMRPGEAIRGFLDALGVSRERIPPDLDAQAGLYRSLLAGRRMLILMDNARDADQALPLLPGTETCLVVVTSRDRMTGLIAAAGADSLTLDLPSALEAREMLAGAVGAQRFGDEPGAVAEIVQRCARLPLALSIVAARAAACPDFPLSTLATELSKADGGPDMLDMLDGGDLASDARAVFSWSIQRLSPAAQRMFRCLGGHPGPDLTTAAAASGAGLPVGRARVLLAELCRAHLIGEAAPGRFYLHDLLRVYSQEQAMLHDTTADRLAVLHRGLDHYLHSAFACARLLHPYRDLIAMSKPRPGVTPERPDDYAEARAWFSAEHAVLLCCVKAAVGTGLDGYVWRLAWTMWTYLDRQGRWRDMVAVGRAGLADAMKIGHVRGQAASHRMLSAAALRLGRYRPAQGHLRCALELYRRAGDVIGEATTHSNMGVVWEGRGRYAEALDHAQQSLALYRIGGHQRGHAQALNAVGWYHALLGNYVEAIECCREALASIEELGDVVAEALTCDSLGYAHHRLGDYAEAVVCYRRAIERYEELGDRYDEAMSLARLGDVRADGGQHDAAREAWTDAQSILEELAHPEAAAVRERLRRRPV